MGKFPDFRESSRFPHSWPINLKDLQETFPKGPRTLIRTFPEQIGNPSVWVYLLPMCFNEHDGKRAVKLIFCQPRLMKTYEVGAELGAKVQARTLNSPQIRYVLCCDARSGLTSGLQCLRDEVWLTMKPESSQRIALLTLTLQIAALAAWPPLRSMTHIHAEYGWTTRVPRWNLRPVIFGVNHSMFLLTSRTRLLIIDVS